ncbi:MAG: class I SAM-dependent methyltransferase [Gemmatimonadales bacterium]|nr:class I SAM-dependent methyltransferase [Gemmatimonadales bacterium]
MITPPLGDALGGVRRLPTHLEDLRDTPPDLFQDWGSTDWARLRWSDVRRPYRVERWSREKHEWERAHGQPMPVSVGWEHFNRHFHALFTTDVPAASARARTELAAALARLDVAGAREACTDLLQLAIWNRIHRVEDAVWDPRGKRALFSGLGVVKPRILFLGAAEGYEAMQLYAMYPGGDVVLVDYDPFCRDHRFAGFPEAYPFLGTDPATGHARVWHRDEMPIHYEVADIRDLRYGREFDIVISVGLIEHFPDEWKPLALDFHRRFLKPGGWCLMTTPRDQLRARAYYHVMGDLVNFGYRELMDVRQMGLYAWENGFDIVRAGVIKAHNGLVTRPR